MQFKSFIKKLACVAMICGAVSVMNSCKPEQKGDEPVVGTGNISGVVLDTEGTPVSGVAVSLLNNDKFSTTTDGQGAYALNDVPRTKQVVVFAKEGYASYAVVLPLKNFSEGTAKIDATIQFAQAVVKGKVLDGANGNKPLAGATVTLGTASTTSGSDGAYEFKGLVIQEYTVTISKGDGTKSFSTTVAKADFIDGTATVMDIAVGGKEILPGLTAFDLKTNGIKIFANEYWGGKSVNVNWACTFMSASLQSSQELKTKWTNMEYQNEGWCCRVRNDRSQTEADMDNFDSFIYGTKLITEDNKILTVDARTHQGSASSPAFIGVQVVDLTAADPVAVKVGETYKKTDTDYKAYTFDLGAYAGKEVTVVIGVYYGGSWWVQTPIRKIVFAPSAAKVGRVAMPGTEIAGFKYLTVETVKSMTLETRKSFTGLPSAGTGVTDGKAGYQGWQGTNHICANWGFFQVSKDTEPLNGEGFIIKTTNGKDADYVNAESYFYGKFAIKAGCNNMTLTTRTYSDDLTTFKVCAITEDGTVTALAPKSNTAKSAKATSEGCWEFSHNNQNTMATFTYDLSQFNGKNVVLTLGVHKGAVKDGEQKLAICAIDLY